MLNSAVCVFLPSTILVVELFAILQTSNLDEVLPCLFEDAPFKIDRVELALHVFSSS